MDIKYSFSNKEITLMISGLPKTMTQNDFFLELNLSGCADTFNYCYVPKRSMYLIQGLAYINFKSFIYAKYFITKWSNKIYPNLYKNKKPLIIKLAKIQGRIANLDEWWRKHNKINNKCNIPFGFGFVINQSIN
jgi:hypothetical protein